MSEGSSFSTSLLTLLTFQVLVCLLILILAIQVGVKWDLVDLFSPNDTEHLFLCFLATFFSEMSIQVLYPFKELGCLFVVV